MECYQSSLAISRDLEDLKGEGESLVNIAQYCSIGSTLKKTSNAKDEITTAGYSHPFFWAASILVEELG